MKNFELVEFLKLINGKVVALHRSGTLITYYKLDQYRVNIENLTQIEGLTSKLCFGNGNTIDEAITDLCNKLSNSSIYILNKRYKCPQLIYTKPIGYDCL